MAIDWEQVGANEVLINEQIGAAYPGVKVVWEHDFEAETSTPQIHLPEALWPQHNEIITAVQDLIAQCGSEAEFYPDQAYELE